MTVLRLSLCALLVYCVTSVQALAQPYCPDAPLNVPQTGLTIGTKFAPPFIMGAKNAPDGIGRDLLDLMADCFDLPERPFTFVEYGTNADLLAATAAGEVDLAISALPITVADEATVDFSVPYFASALGAAVPDRTRTANFTRLVASIFDSNILGIIFGLLVFMVAVAVSHWWLERRSGNDMFAGGPVAGIYKALIWAAMLLFQGESDPFELKSKLGQFSVLMLMFVGVTVVSSFTAIIASSLTLQALEPEVRTIADLRDSRVAVIDQSEAAVWAADQRINAEALKALSLAQLRFDAGEIDVLVHEQDILRYLINTDVLTGIKLAPLGINPRNFAIALPQGSPLRESVNLAVLSIAGSPVWDDRLRIYFGDR